MKQRIYKFENGYGASVLERTDSDELAWEIAVLEFKGNKSSITYETPLTKDVLGATTKEELDQMKREDVGGGSG